MVNRLTVALPMLPRPHISTSILSSLVILNLYLIPLRTLSSLTQQLFAGIIAVVLTNFNSTLAQSFRAYPSTHKSIRDMQTLSPSALKATSAK